MIVPVELDFKSITSGSPQQDVDVANYDLWMTFVSTFPLVNRLILTCLKIKNVHDIPEALNIDKFKLALSKALAIYRHACGRLSKDMNGDGMLLWKVSARTK